MLQSRPLGTTDVNVSHISFGCASIANLYVSVSDKAAHDVLSYAWQRGIRYFDTAPHYGRGLSETRLGRFLQTVPKNEVTLSSKVGRVLTPGKQRSEADGFVSPSPTTCGMTILVPELWRVSKGALSGWASITLTSFMCTTLEN
ncbi:aldo/keto reductase [Falsihalocynthiibacter arcticus]|uniref:aldo/keto reductase n=1 Tax=Falsihalocynthiibacter arcticus TaxID=1579316 RepID=UPI002029E930|nr:aldo/keto reductase [Falsihalocynthiibacter arcticus]